MKIQQKWLGVITGAIASLAISSTSMAAELPAENPLYWSGTGSETINFTDIDINYRNGKSRKGIVGDSLFFAESTSTSIFELNGGLDRPGTAESIFNGYLVIDAQLSSRGKLRDASSFGIYSDDAKFANQGYLTDYNCNKQGNGCSTSNLVFGGSITDFGWSSGNGILDFEISNLSGWALDAWTSGYTAGSTEHLRLNVHGGVFDLGGVSSVKAFTATADGFAVVPVPAAAWLFGSGLIGLVGFARRKRA